MTKESEIMQKIERNRSLEAKGEILWGREKMRRLCFIEAVGSPSRRALPRKHGDRSRASGCNRTVRTTEPRLSGRNKRPSERFTLKRHKLRKNLQKLFFLRSASEHACIINKREFRVQSAQRFSCRQKI